MLLKKFYNNYLYAIKPEKFFLCLAICIGITMTLITPPLQTPDDLNHFYRAFVISEGHFLPVQKDHRLGGEIPVSFKAFTEPFEMASGNEYCRSNIQDIINGFQVELNLNKREFRDFPNTSYYSPVSYIPQSLAIFILRQFDVSVGTLYYGGRLAAFLNWLICMFLIIRIFPFYKWLFTLLMLMPMQIYIANSYSADTITNILSFLMIALILKHCVSKKSIRFKDLLFILMVAITLAFAKILYVTLILLVMAIPASKFRSKKFRYFGIGFLVLVAFSCAYFWSAEVVKYYTSYSTYNQAFKDGATLSQGADYHLQKAYTLAHKEYIFRVFYHTLVDDPKFYLLSYVGGFGTFLHLFMPGWICIMTFLFIVFIAFSEKNKFVFSAYQKLVFVSVALGTFLLLLLSQHLTWNPVGNESIAFFQGRYLIPLFPLVFLLFNSKIEFNFHTDRLVVFFCILINLYACRMMHDGFIHEPACDKVEFFCGAENIDEWGSYKTSNPNIFLGGGSNQSANAQRHGKHAMLIRPENPYSFSYQFKDLAFGDVIEIEAWQKGQGGTLVVSGGGKDCENFYFPNADFTFEDKNGWSKLHMVFSMRLHCKKSEATFYIYNSGKLPVYIDDIHFVFKKLKPGVLKSYD